MYHLNCNVKEKEKASISSHVYIGVEMLGEIDACSCS